VLQLNGPFWTLFRAAIETVIQKVLLSNSFFKNVLLNKHMLHSVLQKIHIYTKNAAFG
jgi:hypothetical protein